MSVQTTE
jgi:hypothetical protein